MSTHVELSGSTVDANLAMLLSVWLPSGLGEFGDYSRTGDLS